MTLNLDSEACTNRRSKYSVWQMLPLILGFHTVLTQRKSTFSQHLLTRKAL